MVWSPPEAPRYKINYDVTTFAEDITVGLGIVILNSEGLVMASLTQQIPLLAIVIEIEPLAAWRAMELALEIGLANIVLEGDNETMFKALKSGDRSLAQHDHLTKDILFLSSYCSAFTVSFICRQCNKLAHSLPFMTIWMEDVPPDLVSIFQADLTSLS